MFYQNQRWNRTAGKLVISYYIYRLKTIKGTHAVICSVISNV